MVITFKQGTKLQYILGVSEDLPCENEMYNQRVCHSVFCDVLFFSVTVVDQMVLGPVSCPAKIHHAAIFALRNGKLSRMGLAHPTIPPLTFVPPFKSDCIEEKEAHKDNYTSFTATWEIVLFVLR